MGRVSFLELTQVNQILLFYKKIQNNIILKKKKLMSFNWICPLLTEI